MSRTIRRKNTTWLKKYYVRQEHQLQQAGNTLKVFWPPAGGFIFESHKFIYHPTPQKQVKIESAFYHSDAMSQYGLRSEIRKHLERRYRHYSNQNLKKAITEGSEDEFFLDHPHRNAVGYWD